MTEPKIINAFDIESNDAIKAWARGEIVPDDLDNFHQSTVYHMAFPQTTKTWAADIPKDHERLNIIAELINDERVDNRNKRTLFNALEQRLEYELTKRSPGDNRGDESTKESLLDWFEDVLQRNGSHPSIIAFAEVGKHLLDNWNEYVFDLRTAKAQEDFDNAQYLEFEKRFRAQLTYRDKFDEWFPIAKK